LALGAWQNYSLNGTLSHGGVLLGVRNLPKDYWREDGFVYRLQGNGYSLYSVGPDGRDDQGKRISMFDLFSHKSGDIVL
jgi:hypothetical protein